MASFGDARLVALFHAVAATLRTGSKPWTISGNMMLRTRNREKGIGRPTRRKSAPQSSVGARDFQNSRNAIFEEL
jgi:hypothetical protein